MTSIKKITKSTIIYLIGNVGTKLIAFILLPLYTRYINPNDYGLYDVNVTYISFIVSFFFLDIWCGIMRFTYDYKDKQDKYKVIYNGMSIFIASTILSILTFLFINLIFPFQYAIWVFLFGFSVCIQNLYTYVSRAFGNNFLFAVSGVICTVVNAGLNILFLVVFQMDYCSLYISFVIGVLVQCMVLEVKVKLLIHFKFQRLDFSITKALFAFSLPLCINSFCYWFLTGYNKVVISNSLSLIDNGYFAIASKFGATLKIVVSCLLMAWQELAFTKGEHTEKNTEFYSKAINLYVKTLFCGLIIILPFINILFPFFVDISYLSAKSIIPQLIVATILSLLSSFLSSIFGAYKKTKSIFVSTLVGSMINVCFIHTTIGFLGLQSACLAMICGYFAICLIRLFLLKKNSEIKFNYKVLLYMIPFIGCSSFAYFMFNAVINFGFLLLGILISFFLFKDYIFKFSKKVFKRFYKSNIS